MVELNWGGGFPLPPPSIIGISRTPSKIGFRNYGSDESKSLFEALMAKTLFTLIMSMVYSNSSKQYAHMQGEGYKSTFVSKT